MQNIKLIGLHFHIGSQITYLNDYKGLCLRVNEIQQWFYERMRGEYQVQKMKQKDLGKNKKSKLLEISPTNMKFTKEDLAKFINCWHYQDPHVACTGAQKSFVTFMNLLNDKKFHEKIDDEFFQK